MPNKLQDEQSPYLKQHAENPVSWYPWGDEAFKKAKEENKPIFLSIGYATCHWCHVMAHESFEDPEIAELMNEAFINVKVDREERPDIDSIYMTVCQMLTGQGGWPLTIIMTPEKEPFFAGTYIPKEARHDRIGLRQLIPGVSGMWQNEPKRIKQATDKIREAFSKTQEFEGGQFPGTEATDFAAEQLARRFDNEHGGFGESPKFPSPHNLMFLLRQWKITGEERFLNMVSTTLEKMRLGGIWDHIGFGFHRYSTDREWLLPHFEKMLYDQALMLMIYTEAWQATENPLFKQTVYEITEYIERNMLHPEGGFYSAEDADSEGEEGKFYVWELDEFSSLLDDNELDFIKRFSITKEGNFEDEATQQKTGANIPHLSTPLNEKEQVAFETVRKKMFNHRQKRVHPLLDDKVLTDWNGLLIAALAKAGFAFDEPKFLSPAENAFQFLETKLVKNGKLLHRYKDGETGITAMADDYAFLTWALIELYGATSKAEYLEKAVHWNQKFLELFWDEEGHGFYFSIMDDDQVYGRQKQIYDGALPSSNSAAMLNLIRLSRLTGQTELEDYAYKLGKTFSADLIRSGDSISYAMQSIQFLHADATEFSLAGASQEIKDAVSLLRPEFSPFSVLHQISDENKEALTAAAPYTGPQSAINDELTLYICRNFSCKKPIHGLEAVTERLNTQ